MRLLLITSLFVLPLLTSAQSLRVKADGVKISFIADMQKTEGTVGGFMAKINFNLDDLAASTIQGSVDANTLSTNNDKRDEHLKSADYFDAEKYPKMSFTSKSIVKEANSYVMTGTMKIKNVEREEKITFTYKDKIFVAEGTIQAANYDLGNFAKKDPNQTNVKISFAIPVE
jgi:polyisoprenoid-binding protein YceI